MEQVGIDMKAEVVILKPEKWKFLGSLKFCWGVGGKSNFLHLESLKSFKFVESLQTMKVEMDILLQFSSCRSLDFLELNLFSHRLLIVLILRKFFLKKD